MSLLETKAPIAAELPTGDAGAAGRPRSRARASAAGRVVVLTLICVVFAYPLAWLLLGSLKTSDTFFSNLWGLPDPWAFENYLKAWNVGKIGRYLFNSAVVSATTLAIVLLTALPLAYAIARTRLPGGKAALGVFAITLFLPMQLLVIPLYELESDLGIINTYWALILPYSAGALPFAVVFGVTYLRTLPSELDEAALLDGCNQLQIFWYVIVPLARPAIATMVVMTFLSIWNEFVLALTLSQSDAVRTLPVGLLNFSQQYGVTDYPLLFAALAVATIPILTVFLLMQRQFVRGLVEGAVRG